MCSEMPWPFASEESCMLAGIFKRSLWLCVCAGVGMRDGAGG